MSPERSGDDARRALGAYIRDPSNAPPPAGIEERRLKIYRELFFNNIESLLSTNFPVIRRILGDATGDMRWSTLVRDFYRDHPSRTPLFTGLGGEFVRYLESRATPGDAAGPPAHHDPAWLPELAHYEWVELALQISDARIDDIPHDPDGNLLDGRPLLSPLAWPLSYAWPVHRIGPDHQPHDNAPPPEPTFLMLQRDPAGKVHFQQLSALTFRLLQRLDQYPGLAGRAQLQALAQEAATECDAAFIARGLAMLQQLHAAGAVPGTRID